MKVISQKANAETDFNQRLDVWIMRLSAELSALGCLSEHDANASFQISEWAVLVWTTAEVAMAQTLDWTWILILGSATLDDGKIKHLKKWPVKDNYCIKIIKNCKSIHRPLFYGAEDWI